MFMKQLKFIFTISVTMLLVSSCGEYQTLLKKGTLGEKTSAAEAYYKEGDFKKALRLYQLIAPQYRGKSNAERVLFYEADTYFQLEDYYFASYKFDKFINSFPKSDNRQVAEFKAARSLYELSSTYSLDQTETYDAIDRLQRFINDYPESEFVPYANEYVSSLHQKLEQKYYEIAKRYHHRAVYKSAIKAFDIYLVDYPGSSYMEEALYYKQESAYLLAINSFQELVPERLQAAKEYNDTYMVYAKNEDLIKKAKKIAEDISTRLSSVN